jgi:hypothetical protein
VQIAIRCGRQQVNEEICRRKALILIIVFISPISSDESYSSTAEPAHVWFSVIQRKVNVATGVVHHIVDTLLICSCTCVMQEVIRAYSFLPHSTKRSLTVFIAVSVIDCCTCA